jgi:hypothetical protein
MIDRRRSITGLLGAGLCFALAACSDEEPPTGSSEAEREAALACDALGLPPVSDGVQLKMPLALEAGDEREICQLVKLERDVNMNWSEGLYTSGSHHGLVHTTSYRDTIPGTTIDGQTLDGTQPHPCIAPQNMWDTTGVLAGGRSQASGPNAFGRGLAPPDVAVKLHKGDYVLINFHMLNYTKQRMTSCYKANLNGIPAAQVEREAGVLFWYNPFITVPARSESTARLACEITQDIELATAVSHGHSRLDGYRASLLSGDPEAQGTSEIRKLHETTEWDEPEIDSFSPALSISKGQWIDYECHFTNKEDRNIAQGSQTTDEMCMFIGLYWPKNEALESCGRDFDSGQPVRVYGNGTKSGADFLPCLNAIPQERRTFIGGGAESSAERYAAMSCFTQTCPEASGLLGPMVQACPQGQEPDADCIKAATALGAVKCD